MLGFLGLGQMGGAIVERLLDGGAELAVFDIDSAAVDRAVAHGAVRAASAMDVANRAAIVMACLPTVATALSVGREACAGSAVKIYAELSTVGRSALHGLDAIARSAGIDLVDAPVSGGPAGARKGSLSLMLAGQSAACDRVAAALSHVAGATIRLGDEPGQAQLCKLVNNGISMTAFLVSCEAIAVGAGAGIDPALLVEIVNAGTGRNTATTDKIPQHILPRTFAMGAPLGSALKDLDLYLAEAEAAGLPEGVISETRALWSRAIDALDPKADASTVVRYFEAFVGSEVSA